MKALILLLLAFAQTVIVLAYDEDPAYRPYYAESQEEALVKAQLKIEQAGLELARRAQLDAEQTQTDTLRQGAAFYAGLPLLQRYLDDNGYKPGSREYAAVYAGYASGVPLALRYLPEVAKTVQEHTRVYDTQGQLQQNLDIATGLGRTLKSVEIGDLGVRVKADIAPSASQQLEDELLKSHHISRVQFENLAEAKRGTLDSKGEFKQSDNGLMIQFMAGESKQGKPQVHTMSVTEFNLYKKAFGQQPLSQSAQ